MYLAGGWPQRSGGRCKGAVGTVLWQVPQHTKDVGWQAHAEEACCDCIAAIGFPPTVCSRQIPNWLEALREHWLALATAQYPRWPRFSWEFGPEGAGFSKEDRRPSVVMGRGNAVQAGHQLTHGGVKQSWSAHRDWAIMGWAAQPKGLERTQGATSHKGLGQAGTRAGQGRGTFFNFPSTLHLLPRSQAT